MGISVQFMGCKCWHRTTIVGMQHVKGDQIPALSFVKRDLKHPTDESLLLVGYMWMNAS